MASFLSGDVTLGDFASLANERGGRLQAQRADTWRMSQPRGAQPSQLILIADVRSALGIYADPTFSDADLLDLLLSAEEVIEAKLYAPLRSKRVDEYYSRLRRRLALSVRGMGEAGPGTFALPDGTEGLPTVTITTDAGEVVVDAATYALDVSSEVPAVVFTTMPSSALSSAVANAVHVAYQYTPIVPNRVKAAVEQSMRAFFNARNSGMPYPANALRATLDGMLLGISPVNF